MSMTAKLTVVIIWQEELISAARAVQRMAQKDCTEEDTMNALRACYAALSAPELASGENPVVICCAHRPQQAPK